MNNITLSGRITKEIELKQTQTGKGYVRNSIAVKRSRKNASGDYETDFFDFEVWNGTAEYLANFGYKGGRIEIAGELQNNNYQKNDGSMVYGNRIVVNKLEIIDYVGESQQQPQSQQQNMNAFQQPVQQPFQAQPTFEQPAMNGFGAAMQQTAPNAEIGDGDLPF